MSGIIKVKDMALCAIFTVLVAVGAFIKVPIPVLPFTLQFLFTMLAGLLLGSKLGALSVTVYAIVGLLGVPVFSEGGGFWYILNPTFGYIIGFILGTFVTGLIVEKQENLTYGKILLANFVGLVIVYAVGMIYYYVICNCFINNPIGVKALFLYCFVLAVPGDICLCFVAALLAKKLRPIMKRIV